MCAENFLGCKHSECNSEVRKHHCDYRGLTMVRVTRKLSRGKFIVKSQGRVIYAALLFQFHQL